MPQLLDLPPEIFHRITHELVAGAGVVEAWKLRGTCRTFAHEIHYDVFARQPKEVVRPIVDSTLMRENIGLYLNNQLSVPLDAHGPLFPKLKELLGFVAAALSIYDHDRRQGLGKVLCTGIASVISSAALEYTMWDQDSRHDLVYPDLLPNLTLRATIEDKVTAAASVGACDLVTALLQPEYNADNTAFHSPLYIAINLNDEQMVRTILAFYARTARVPQFEMDWAVKLAIEGDKAAILRLLLNHWFQENNPPSEEKLYRLKWLYLAIAYHSIPLIDVVLSTRKTQKGALPREEVQAICENGTASLMTHYFQNGQIDANTAWYNTSPLIMATKSQDVSKIRAVLAAGADIDKAAGNKSTALFIACREKDGLAARFLLRAGASTDFSKWPARNEVAWWFYHEEIAGT